MGPLAKNIANEVNPPATTSSADSNCLRTARQARGDRDAGLADDCDSVTVTTMMSLGLPSAIDHSGRHHPSHKEQEVGGFWGNGVPRG